MLWDLVPGQRLDRSDVHARFGGLARGRISPSRASENILLFTTPTTIASAFDGWTGDRVLFGGTGGSNGGDQSLTYGNATILRHEEEQRALRLFLQQDNGIVEYVGAYRLDPLLPFVHADAPADLRRSLEVRRVVIFRLIPVDDPPKGLPIASPTSSEREIHKTEPGVRSSPFDGEPSPAQQTAAKLLLRYAAFARWSRQAEVTGYRIKTRASLTDLHVDLFDVTHNEVLVVLPSCARPGIWEALGRLHDQARFFTPLPRRVLLLPDEPDADLTELLLVQHVTAVWPSGPREFSRTSSML